MKPDTTGKKPAIAMMMLHKMVPKVEALAPLIATD
jgi:hypothetical protein